MGVPGRVQRPLLDPQEFTLPVTCQQHPEGTLKPKAVVKAVLFVWLQ